LNERPLWDKAKGELHIMGQRHTAVDVQGLCNNLDLILGPKVAEVVMNQHEFRQGKADVVNMREKMPGAPIQEIIKMSADAETLSGVGAVSVTLPESLPGPVDLEILNPCVKRTTGAAKSLLFSYWCGVFSELLGKEFKIEQVTYDEGKNLMKCRITPR